MTTKTKRSSLKDRLANKSAGIGTEIAKPEADGLPAHAARTKTAPGALMAYNAAAVKKDQEIAELRKSIQELQSLLNSSPASPDDQLEVDVDLLDESPYQDRLDMDEDEQEELANSIRIGGLNEPIQIRPKSDGRYEIVSGHRRTDAVKRIPWRKIPATIKRLDDSQAELTAILQNIGRKNLSDLELALSYRRALDSRRCKNQGEVAALFSTNQPAVAECLRFLKLPGDIFNLIKTRPRTIGRKCAKDILDLLEAHEGSAQARDIIAEGVRRVVEDGANQNNLKAWINRELATKAQPTRTKRNKSYSLTDREGVTIGSARIHMNKVVVDVTNSPFPLDEVCQMVANLLNDEFRKREDK